MCSYYINQVSRYDPTKLAILTILRPEDDLLSNRGRNLKKTVSSGDILHFIDEEDNVTNEDFDCGISFYPWTPTKIKQTTENGNTFLDPVKNASAFQVTIGLTVSLINSITLISFWIRTIYGTWFQQLLCQSITLMIHNLCSISTLNQQLNNLE